MVVEYSLSILEYFCEGQDDGSGDHFDLQTLLRFLGPIDHQGTRSVGIDRVGVVEYLSSDSLAEESLVGLLGLLVPHQDPVHQRVPLHTAHSHGGRHHHPESVLQTGRLTLTPLVVVVVLAAGRVQEGGQVALPAVLDPLSERLTR